MFKYVCHFSIRPIYFVSKYLNKIILLLINHMIMRLLKQIDNYMQENFGILYLLIPENWLATTNLFKLHSTKFVIF